MHFALCTGGEAQAELLHLCLIWRASGGSAVPVGTFFKNPKVSGKRLAGPAQAQQGEPEGPECCTVLARAPCSCLQWQGCL